MYTTLPSSHSSPAWTTPSPQTGSPAVSPVAVVEVGSSLVDDELGSLVGSLVEEDRPVVVVAAVVVASVPEVVESPDVSSPPPPSPPQAARLIADATTQNFNIRWSILTV